MTLKELQKIASANGFSVRKVDDEYQTKPKTSKWDDSDGLVHFCNDIDEAYGYLKHEVRRLTRSNFLKGPQEKVY